MDRPNEKSLKVLFATPYKTGIGGGIAQWAENIMRHYKALEALGLHIEVLPMGRVANIKITSLVKRAVTGVVEYAAIIRKERQMLKSGQYDVLHLCTSASMSLVKDLVMIALAKRYHARTVVHFHFGRIPQLRKAGNWEWKLLCRVVRKADMAVPIDQQSYDALAAAGFTNIEYLPNPVAQKVSDFVSQHSGETHRDERMVFFAGHCIKTKGIYELVQACSQLENIRLVLAGHIEEEIKRELEELAHHEPWLVIKGELPHEEILRLMLQCGVYVLPSYTEGFPNVILESMACSCAIAATTVGAIPEMIGEEAGKHYGLLVPPQDTESLAAAIGKLLSDSDLRKEYRRNACRRVNERYNMEVVWEKLIRIWQKTAAESADSHHPDESANVS